MNEEKKTINLTTPLLVILLAAASFLAGSFWTKLSPGKSSEEVTGEPGAKIQASPAPQAPEEVILGDADVAKIESGGAGTKGDKGASVTIVEFSEYQCPFCGRYVKETYPQIFEEYGDQVYYVFHDYPLPFHQHAQETAEAARCAADQGKYWEMHDQLFENQEEWSEASEVTDLLVGYAAELGLSTGEFSGCLDSGKHTQAVKDDFELGKSVGVSGTPTFFINGQKLVGALPFASFKQLIDAQLQE